MSEPSTQPAGRDLSGGTTAVAARGASGGPAAWVRLARPKQWAKSVFVVVGPLYGLADATRDWHAVVPAALAAAVAFALLSSACYIVNDILDAPRDRLHPRKRLRPIAAGVVSPKAAGIAAVILALAGLATIAAAVPSAGLGLSIALLAAYALNVTAYSLILKHVVIADVICLSLGFVIRVLAGCAATGVTPSTWLLNVTFFLAMFLSFCKRLGERRTMKDDASAVRAVQEKYTDELLRMSVVVTGVATLGTYAAYVQAQERLYTHGFNLLWLTMIPLTYGLLRAMVLVERGRYDDPTELAAGDRQVQAAGLAFVGIAAGLMFWVRGGG